MAEVWINKSKKNTKQILLKLSKDKKFNKLCQKKKIPELPKCMESLTKEPSPDKNEIKGNKKALSTKLVAWPSNKIQHSKSKNYFLALFYIMVKTVSADDNSTNIEICNTKDTVRSSLNALKNSKTFKFGSFKDIIKKFDYINNSTFSDAIIEIVGYINNSNINKLEIPDEQPQTTGANKNNTKNGLRSPNTAQSNISNQTDTSNDNEKQETNEMQIRMQIRMLLPDKREQTIASYDGYMDLYKHPNLLNESSKSLPSLSNTLYGTQIEIPNKPGNIIYLIPAFKEFIPCIDDTSKLTCIRLAIERLISNKKLFTLNMGSKRFVAKPLEQIPYDKLNEYLSGILETLDRRIQDKNMQNSNNDNEKQETNEMQIRMQIRMLLPDKREQTIASYDGYMDLYKHPNLLNESSKSLPSLSNTLYGTQIEIPNKPGNIIYLIPAFKEFIPCIDDTSKLTCIRLAIERLISNKKLFTLNANMEKIQRFVAKPLEPIPYDKLNEYLSGILETLDRRIQNKNMQNSNYD